MKGNFQRPGNVNEMAGSMEINLAVFAENAKHNPVGAKLFGAISPELGVTPPSSRLLHNSTR